MTSRLQVFTVHFPQDVVEHFSKLQILVVKKNILLSNIKLSSSRYSLGEGVEAGGVDAAAHVDVDGCGVAGGGRHHGDPLPRLALDVRHAGHPHERHSHGVTSTSTTSVTIYCEQL